VKQNVLYISYDGMTDPLGQSQVLPYIAGLSKTYQFHLISFEKAGNFTKNKRLIEDICEKHNIVWHPLKYTKNPPIFSTLSDINKMKKLTIKLDEKFNFKIIHCRSYIASLIGLYMKQKYQKKFIFDMRGFWADERVDGKLWNLKNPVYKFIYNYFKKKEKQFLQVSDSIVSLTKNGKNEILSWNILGVTENKITVIPCCVDLNIFDPEKIDIQQQMALKSHLRISDNDYVLGYVGSLGTWYMLDEMLHYFKVFSSTNANTKFLFISGENPQDIYNKATQYNIPRDKIVVTKCLHKDVPLHISLFDASIFFILPAYSKKASSPTKQGELMAMGIPVICNSGIGDTGFVIKTYESGILINQFIEDDYKEGSIKLNNDTFDILKIKEGAKDFYGLENGLENYFKVYNQLSHA